MKVGIIGKLEKIKTYIESNNLECIIDKDVFAVDADIIVLDGENENLIEKVEQFKKYNRNLPLVVVLQKKDYEKTIKFLENGADEVIEGKNPAVVFAYIKAILRRIGKWRDRKITSSDGKVEIDVSNAEVTVNGEKMIFPPKEIELLSLLLTYRNQLLTREFILNSIWGSAEIETHTLEVHINRIRKKLGKLGNRILTIPRRGYKFVD